MIAALIYLHFHSAVNRFRARMRRLKQPKYLVAAIVGGAYLWFYVARFFLMPSRPRAAIPVGSAQVFEIPVGLLEGLGALVLFGLVLSAWVFPRERTALIFSEAEIAFLFPAPVSRRGLIHYKLARSQLSVLFTTLLLTLFSGRWRGGPVQAIIGVMGWWFVLATLNLHFLACSLTRTMLLDRGVSNWLRRTVALSVAAAIVGFTYFWARQSMPTLELSEVSGFKGFTSYLNEVLDSGPAPYLLLPFRVALRPFLATGFGDFALALPAAILLLAVHYFWVIKTNVAFEEASVTASEKVARQLTEIRAGKAGMIKPKKPRRDPFRLRPQGWPMLALLWKNLIAAGAGFTARRWLLVLWIALVMCLAVNGTSGAERSWRLLVAGLVAGLLGVSFFIGPMAARVDLRQDLEVADLLKAYPLRGWQVVLGELLTPVVILAAIQWLLVIVLLMVLPSVPHFPPLWGRAACAVGVMVLAPFLDLTGLLIPNAAAVLLPGWMPRGKERPQGVEATGQAMILLLGQLLVLIFALLPAAGVAVGVFFLGKLLVPWPAVVPFAALGAAVILAGEAAAAIWQMGRFFERMDVSSELGQ